MAEATAEATTQQIAWIREAAGDRFAQIEIGNFVIGGVKTESEQRLDPRIAATFRSRTTGEQQSPQGIYTLVGSVEQICEQVLSNRERFGISYIGVLEQDLETFAPIVARLSGSGHDWHCVVPPRVGLARFWGVVVSTAHEPA